MKIPYTSKSALFYVNCENMQLKNILKISLAYQTSS